MPFLRKGLSKNPDKTVAAECIGIYHLDEEPASLELLSAESAIEQSPGRKPRVGNFLSWVDDSPVGASEALDCFGGNHFYAPFQGASSGGRSAYPGACAPGFVRAALQALKDGSPNLPIRSVTRP